jgi:hypothetical protein
VHPLLNRVTSPPIKMVKIVSRRHLYKHRHQKSQTHCEVAISAASNIYRVEVKLPKAYEVRND